MTMGFDFSKIELLDFSVSKSEKMLFYFDFAYPVDEFEVLVSFVVKKDKELSLDNIQDKDVEFLFQDIFANRNNIDFDRSVEINDTVNDLIRKTPIEDSLHFFLNHEEIRFKILPYKNKTSVI